MGLSWHREPPGATDHRVRTGLQPKAIIHLTLGFVYLKTKSAVLFLSPSPGKIHRPPSPATPRRSLSGQGERPTRERPGWARQEVGKVASSEPQEGGHRRQQVGAPRPGLSGQGGPLPSIRPAPQAGVGKRIDTCLRRGSELGARNLAWQGPEQRCSRPVAPTVGPRGQLSAEVQEEEVDCPAGGSQAMHERLLRKQGRHWPWTSTCHDPAGLCPLFPCSPQLDVGWVF